MSPGESTRNSYRNCRKRPRVKKLVILARLINLDEDSLICDFAETYHIYDYRAFKPSYCAVLAIGLKDDSRVKMALSETKLNTTQMLLAAIADRVGLLIWQNTENGRKGVKQPVSIITEINRDHSKDIKGFTSGEDLLRELKKYEVK